MDGSLHCVYSNFKKGYLPNYPVTPLEKRSRLWLSMKSINHLKFDSENSIIFYDQKLIQFQAFARWIRLFPNSIGLQAGEELKTIRAYSEILNQVQKLASEKQMGRQFKMIAIGGGSVTDFVGFVAATYQRGHAWIAVPSTWLCAIDSAHGGKNGLNLNEVKNQIGTIHFPDEVIICDELLKLQPLERLIESAGEILKITLISSAVGFDQFKLDEQFILKNLSTYIKFKNKIVKQDPFETKKIRYLLNFGHTVGHIFESEKNLPHGIAILFGMIFAIHFSLVKKFITSKEAQVILTKIKETVFSPSMQMQLKDAFTISDLVFTEKLLQDKKNVGKKINFICIKKRGQVFVREFSAAEITTQFKKLSSLKDYFNV